MAFKKQLISNFFNKISFKFIILIFLIEFVKTNELQQQQQQQQQAQQQKDYCSTNLFNKNSNHDGNYMKFSKEILSNEYAVLEGGSKRLHCCAKGYRTIEWFKDAKPYPWKSEDSSFIIIPTGSNQTIGTNSIRPNDFGNYTCILRNDTHKITHHVQLLSAKNNPDVPLATYKPHDQFAELRSSARFYCEAFVGKVSLPDARSEVTWFHQTPNGNLIKPDGQEESSSRDNSIGKILIIPNVQVHNYGRYLCRIQIGDANPIFESHRLDMFVELHNGKPIEAFNDNSVILMALMAAVLALFLVLSLYWCITTKFRENNKENHCQNLIKSENRRNTSRLCGSLPNSV